MEKGGGDVMCCVVVFFFFSFLFWEKRGSRLGGGKAWAWKIWGSCVIEDEEEEEEEEEGEEGVREGSQ